MVGPGGLARRGFPGAGGFPRARGGGAARPGGGRPHVVAADPGRCHVCPPLPGAAAGSVGSARWRAAMCVTQQGLVRLARPPPRTPFPTCLVLGVQGLAGTLEPTAFVPFQIFLLPSLWRGRRNGEGAGTGRFIGPSLTPPLPGAQIVLEASGAPPQCPDAGAVGGLQWRPLPVRLLPTHVRVAGRLGHHFTCLGLCKSAQLSAHGGAFYLFVLN